MEKIKLMVVDDNREFCCLVKDYAEMTNEVEFCGAAFDGISSLELIRERKPDVILLDNIMPELDGIGVMKHLRNFEKRYKTKSCCNNCITYQRICYGNGPFRSRLHSITQYGY